MKQSGYDEYQNAGISSTWEGADYFIYVFDSAGHSFVLGLSDNGLRLTSDADNLTLAKSSPFIDFDTTAGLALYRLEVTNNIGTCLLMGISKPLWLLTRHTLLTPMKYGLEAIRVLAMRRNYSFSNTATSLLRRNHPRWRCFWQVSSWARVSSDASEKDCPQVVAAELSPTTSDQERSLYAL